MNFHWPKRLSASRGSTHAFTRSRHRASGNCWRASGAALKFPCSRQRQKALVLAQAAFLPLRFLPRLAQRAVWDGIMVKYCVERWRSSRCSLLVADGRIKREVFTMGLNSSKPLLDLISGHQSVGCLRNFLVRKPRIAWHCSTTPASLAWLKPFCRKLSVECC